MGDIMGNIVKVGTLDLPDLDIYARSTEAELLHLYEPDGGIFIAESPKVICRALDAGCRPISLLAEPKQLEGEGREALSRCGQVPVYVAAPEVLSQIPGHAVRHAPPAPSFGGGPLRPCPPDRSSGKCHEPHQCRRDHPFCGRPGHGCRAAGPGMQRSPISPRHPGEHGHRLPDPLDL